MKQALRRLSAAFACSSVIGMALPSQAQTKLSHDQTDYIFYDAKLGHSSWFYNPSESTIRQNTVLVCNADTAILYRATAILNVPNPQWGRFLGTIPDQKMIYVRYPNGAAMDIENQMNMDHLSLSEKVNVRKCLSHALGL